MRMIRMPAKRAMEYRTKLLHLYCGGGADVAASLEQGNKLLGEAINDRPLLDAGWELHDVVGLTRSQWHVRTNDRAEAGPAFVLIVFRRILRER